MLEPLRLAPFRPRSGPSITKAGAFSHSQDPKPKSHTARSLAGLVLARGIGRVDGGISGRILGEVGGRRFGARPAARLRTRPFVARISGKSPTKSPPLSRKFFGGVPLCEGWRGRKGPAPTPPPGVCPIGPRPRPARRARGPAHCRTAVSSAPTVMAAPTCAGRVAQGRPAAYPPHKAGREGYKSQRAGCDIEARGTQVGTSRSLAPGAPVGRFRHQILCKSYVQPPGGGA